MPLPQPVLLYDQPRAPNPRRLNIFLAEKGVDVPRTQVDLMQGAHKTPDYLARTPAPQVPALELDDGAVLVESVAIARYIEALHPEPNMLGRDPLDTAEIEQWQRLVEFRLFGTITACFRHTNPHMAALEDQCADWGEVNRGRIDGRLAELDRRLRGRDWLAGGRLTMADITAFVAVDFLKVLKHPVPEALADLTAWLARMRARPSTAL